jgi:hypothetical protein
MAASEYELWATQHGLPESQAVQVLEFQHAKWGSYWVSDYGAVFAARTEGGVDFTADAVAFEVDLPKQSNSTQSEMTVRMDALSGFVIAQLRGMTDAQRALPITVIWRCFLDTSSPRVPLLDPLGFIVIDVAATRLAVEIRCAATLLPNIAAGTRYTMDKFPTLAYL